MPHNKLPERWLDYTKMGTRIEESRFIAAKVPLKKEFFKNIPELEQFSPQDLVHLAEDANIKIGLVIDLTFTDRYYDPGVFTDLEIQHVKIKVPGKAIPNGEIFRKFVSVIKEFELKNKDNNKVIVVHCTHGLNRTGYFLCKYLIKENHVAPVKAIAMFNAARGHDMERINYLDDLRTATSKRNAENPTTYAFSNYREQQKNFIYGESNNDFNSHQYMYGMQPASSRYYYHHSERYHQYSSGNSMVNYYGPAYQSRPTQQQSYWDYHQPHTSYHYDPFYRHQNSHWRSPNFRGSKGRGPY